MWDDLLVGAVGGGAAGVIVALASHALQSQQRREQRTEARHAFLRRMLETHMRLAHRVESGSFRIYVWIRTGMTPHDAYYKYLEDEREDLPKAMGDFFWQPHRIDDNQLREWGQSLNDAHFEAEMALQQVTTLDLEAWQQATKVSHQKIRDLSEQIDIRLDELEW